MTVQSKHVLVPDRPVVSWFDAVPYTCHEVGHTWTPYCIIASLQTLRDSMKFSLKLYAGVYLASYLFKIQKKRHRNFKELQRLLLDYLRSSVFLSANGTLFMGGFCLFRHILGKMYGWNAFGVGVVDGYITMHIERKSRRALLGLYVANLATELLFRILVARNLIKPIPNFEVLMFSLSSAGFMALYRSPRGLNEYLQESLCYIVGKWESAVIPTINMPRSQKQRKNDVWRKILSLFEPLIKRIKGCHRSHRACSHPYSCLHYILQGSLFNFTIGFAVQVALNLFQVLRGKKKVSDVFCSLHKLKTLSLALFLGGYNFLFRACNCLLRWIRDRDSPMFHGAVSGAVAGIVSWFYKSSTISLYILFKLMEVLAFKGIEKGVFPYFPNADKLIYAISLGVILHAAVLEPHNIRPGYWTFLIGVSGGRFPYMFRKLMDVFGTKASTLYPDFVPNFDPRHVKSDDAIMLLKSCGKWKGGS